MPILNVYATKDHLVPPAASQALGQFAASKDYEEFSFKGGHIGNTRNAYNTMHGSIVSVAN